MGGGAEFHVGLGLGWVTLGHDQKSTHNVGQSQKENQSKHITLWHPQLAEKTSRFQRLQSVSD